MVGLKHCPVITSSSSRLLSIPSEAENSLEMIVEVCTFWICQPSVSHKTQRKSSLEMVYTSTYTASIGLVKQGQEDPFRNYV